MKKALFNWSGGKDSSFALYNILKYKDFDIKYLLTTVSKEYRRISIHGVREELLDRQALSIGINLHKIYLPEFPSMEDYNIIMRSEMNSAINEGIEYSVFGDIFLEDLREYREKQLSLIGMKASFPLWKIDTNVLVNDFIKTGFKAIVTSVDERYLDKSYAGRIIDSNFLNDLPTNVDPCGENGEFHSFVFDGPIFRFPLNFEKGEVVYRKYNADKINSQNTGFWYCDLLP
jgi:uncharacterized protein (TIGR00290 family)